MEIKGTATVFTINGTVLGPVLGHNDDIAASEIEVLVSISHVNTRSEEYRIPGNRRVDARLNSRIISGDAKGSTAGGSGDYEGDNGNVNKAAHAVPPQNTFTYNNKY
jgi:hypothetical protein